MRNYFPRDYLTYAYFLTGLIVILSGIFVLNSARFYYDNLNQNMRFQTERIIKTLENTFQITSYAMRYVGRNLKKKDPKNLREIHSALRDLNLFDNVISSGYIEKDLSVASQLEWSLFDWVGQNNRQLVNSKIGVSRAPPDMSAREYIKAAKRDPWKLKFSTPDYGVPSGVWVIPIGMGILDDNDVYIGSVAGGLVISNIKEKIKNEILSDKMEFIVIDDKKRFIFGSKPQSKKLFQNYLNQKTSKKEPVFQNNEDSIKDFSDDSIRYVYYEKLTSYPYTVIVGYDKGFFLKKIMYFIVSGILIFSLILIISLLILYIYRKKMVSPIIHLSKATSELLSGKSPIVLPNQKSEEIDELVRQFEKVVKEIKKNKDFHESERENSTLLKKSDREKEFFCKSMNKELENSHNLIIQYINILINSLNGKTNISTPQENTIRLLEKAAHEISNLRDMTSNRVNITCINVNKVIKECLDIYHRDFYDNDIKITEELSENIPEIYTDQMTFKQIILGGLHRCILTALPQEGKIHVSSSLKKKINKDLIEIKMESNGFEFSDSEFENFEKKFDFGTISKITHPRFSTVKRLLGNLGGYSESKGKYIFFYFSPEISK